LITARHSASPPMEIDRDSRISIRCSGVNGLLRGCRAPHVTL
jgi:hypothetical protein